MPELPEVESIRKQLEKFLVGHTIESVDVKNRKIFQGDEKEIVGAKFIGARRFAKVLVLDLNDKMSLMIHVKMTGQLIYKGPNLLNAPPLSKKVTGGVPGPHTHVIFNLDREASLYYNDFRRFGWIKIVNTSEVEKTGLVGKMGPEPFAGLTLEKFKEAISKTRRSIKVVLMDQTRISGVGNIYANDALFLSKINPKTPANSLLEKLQESLYNSIHEVLKKGMQYGGSSENSFVTPDGREGEYQRHTLVYGRQGQICSHCKKNKIIKNMLGGRGTYFCPHCQKDI